MISMLDLVIEDRINEQTRFSGIDSIKHCRDKKWFKQYPYTINYKFNSRGFRDEEWPVENLDNCIWCVGDSFTLGLGSPFHHTWPHLLGKKTSIRTINISIDGASNNWISRISKKIAHEINPKFMVIMWSYTHRRELQDDSLGHSARRQHYEVIDSDLDWQNYLQCKDALDKQRPTVVQFSIPDFHEEVVDISRCWAQISGPSWPEPPTSIDQLLSYPKWLLEEIDQVHKFTKILKRSLEFYQSGVIMVSPLDKARDGHHFDILTAEHVAEQARSRLFDNLQQ